MKKSAIRIIVLLSTILLSCRNNATVKEITDPEEFAAKYCDCMEKNGARKDFLYALTVCDGEFVQKSRLYRLRKIDLKYFETQERIDSLTRDSVFKFARIVDSCTRNNCCESTANCPGATK